jgi:hypothetical protein
LKKHKLKNSTSAPSRFACGEQQIKNLNGNGVFEINVTGMYDNNSPTQISNPRRQARRSQTCQNLGVKT